MRWQLRRIAVFVLAIDTAAVSLAAAGCLVFGALTAVNLATVLLGFAVLLAFAAAGFGDGPARLPFPVMARDERAIYEFQLREELESGVRPSESFSRRMFRGGPAWPLALGIAAIPLIALSAMLATSFA